MDHQESRSKHNLNGCKRWRTTVYFVILLPKFQWNLLFSGSLVEGRKESNFREYYSGCTRRFRVTRWGRRNEWHSAPKFGNLNPCRRVFRTKVVDIRRPKHPECEYSQSFMRKFLSILLHTCTFVQRFLGKTLESFRIRSPPEHRIRCSPFNGLWDVMYMYIFLYSYTCMDVCMGSLLIPLTVSTIYDRVSFKSYLTSTTPIQGVSIQVYFTNV